MLDCERCLNKPSSGTAGVSETTYNCQYSALSSTNNPATRTHMMKSFRVRYTLTVVQTNKQS